MAGCGWQRAHWGLYRQAFEQAGVFGRLAQQDAGGGFQVVHVAGGQLEAGGNIEYVPEEMIKNKAEVIHLATGLVVGYPPCPYIKAFKAFIESRYHVKVVVGTHPIPMKYATEHKKLPYWDEVKMDIVAPELFRDNDMVMKAYD